MKIVKFDNLDLLYGHIYKELKLIENIERNIIMLSGGNSPKPIFRFLEENNHYFNKINFVMSDERLVDQLHEDSNEGAFFRECKSLKNNLISLRDKHLKEKIKKHNEFALSILGFNIDGHFASIFPSDKNVSNVLNDDKILFHVKSKQVSYERYTLGLKCIQKSKKIILISKSIEKTNFIRRSIDENLNLPINHLINSVETKDLKLLTV